MIVKAGSTNVSVYYYIVGDAGHATPGEPVTGLLFSDIETGGSASYARQGAARVDLTLKTLASASAAHDDGGFILVDDTHMKGLYRCDYPDAAFATGVDQTFCSIVVASANNAVAAPILVDIDDNVDQTADHTAGIADVPTVAEFNARTLVAASYFDPAADAVANVTLVGTLTTYTGNTLQTADVAARVPNVLNTTALGNIGVDWANVENPTTALDLSATDIQLCDTITTYTGNTKQTADHTANLAKIPLSDGVVTWNATALASINAECDTAITDGALATAASLATAQTDLDTLTGADGATLATAQGNYAPAKATDILTTALTEAYAADGAAGTLSQILFGIQAFLQERSVAGTTVTSKKVDGSTTAMTFTLDDGTTPTSITRAT